MPAIQTKNALAGKRRMKVGDWQKTYWEDENGNRTTIQDVLDELRSEPVITLEVRKLSGLDTVPIDLDRKENADLSYPIIVIEKDGQFESILDGHHRLQKALDEDRPCILAKVKRENKQSFTSEE